MEELIPEHPNLKFIIETHGIGSSQRHRWQATPQRGHSFLEELVRRLERVMYGLEHRCEWNTLDARFQLRFWRKQISKPRMVRYFLCIRERQWRRNSPPGVLQRPKLGFYRGRSGTTRTPHHPPHSPRATTNTTRSVI